MKIVTIEPTPSPNSMKVVVDQELPFGTSFNYTQDKLAMATGEIAEILAIEGVKSLYHVADFMAIERNAKYTWEQILSEVRAIFGEDVAAQDDFANATTTYGEVYVHVQMYKGIPLQVKTFTSEEEYRIALPDNFKTAVNKIVDTVDDENYLFLRKWSDYGVRYGTLADVAEAVRAELLMTYTADKLAELEAAALQEKPILEKKYEPVNFEAFKAASYEERFAMLDKMTDPTTADLPTLALALADEKVALRRLATVYLGMLEDEAVVPYIEKALQDKSAAVRRTAGDCVSDLGFVSFEPAMMAALQDKNKLVRWRAAMFLFETGTEQALPALHAAENDAEFEVKLQVQMAIARIEQGEEAQGSVWKQMTAARQ